MSEENCKQNIEQEESDARFLIAELAKQNQREHKEKLLILKLWFASAIIIVAAFLLYLYQYDFTSTIEQTGIYTIVDSNGNVISSDIDQEQLKQILEIINGENKNN